MPKEHPAVRLERQRASLKRLETKARRLATLIASRKRSIRGLERSVAGSGPVPAPPPKVPKPPRGKRLDDPVLARLEEWGAKAAEVLGVKAPTVRWAGTKGACQRAARAHIHTKKGQYHYVFDRKTLRNRVIKTPRGTCCVNRAVYGDADDEAARSLMCHEVAHLVRRFGHGSGHGAPFRASMRKALDALGATEDEAVEAAAELLDDVNEGTLEVDA